MNYKALQTSFNKVNKELKSTFYKLLDLTELEISIDEKENIKEAIKKSYELIVLCESSFNVITNVLLKEAHKERKRKNKSEAISHTQTKAFNSTESAHCHTQSLNCHTEGNARSIYTSSEVSTQAKRKTMSKNQNKENSNEIPSI